MNQKPDFKLHDAGPQEMHYVDPLGVEVSIFFGYLDGKPTAALFRGSEEEMVVIPREVLSLALERGWTADDHD